ncbi:hypothetical protein Atai01_13880 [Amycolatopsis taiwanensis]|uniref:Uncharacterized protein n=1 Tax=Amycolatopsis taiwanensis TaxID=342230 RepID=A0A9W6QWC0_9PSEU|nr:hypothetical protein Atai01_13880 [Amycolatopsis taiwanensis]
MRRRTKITKGPGSRAAGLAMAFKLIESAQARWRAVDALHLVAVVRAGARFDNGQLVERPEMGPVTVVVADVFRRDGSRVSLVVDQEPVCAFGADGVRTVRHSNWPSAYAAAS